MAHILHLVSANYFRSLPPDLPYVPERFADDGFIHCTLGGDLMLEVANAFYKDAPGRFQVLVIDASRVAAEVRYEAPHPIDARASGGAGPILFPHIYGPLNREAIVDVVGVRRDAGGAFIGYERAIG